MRDEERLSSLVAAGVDVERGLREVARQLAGFHTRLPTSPAIAEAGSPEAVRGIWEQNFEELRPFRGSLLPEAGVDEARLLATRYLAGRSPLLRARMAQGLVRDGHGDLLAGDIFFTPEGPRILDCLEFDDLSRETTSDLVQLRCQRRLRGRLPAKGPSRTVLQGRFPANGRTDGAPRDGVEPAGHNQPPPIL